MKQRIITIGKRNSTFQHIMAIKDSRYKRHEFNELYVEGVRNINIALKKGWKVKHWIYEQNKTLSNWGTNLINQYETEENYILIKELMEEVSGKNDTSELVAIFEIKETPLDLKSNNPFILLCNKPSKKGNLGTIIRSADSFNVDAVIVTGHSVDIYDPEIIVTSMGSYFAVDIIKIEENKELMSLIKELKRKYTDLQIIATTEEGTKSIKEIDYTKPTMLLMGNEADGLSKFYFEICDKTVKIPMTGEASSLNLACATTIFLYEQYMNRNKF